mmetsp:Transcript_31573/g.94813  ORF Transcript_31573/g.94813 Transcript_31573/m.94813 type:complete len:397 (+) Transcript_31573:223-1413(+)
MNIFSPRRKHAAPAESPRRQSSMRQQLSSSPLGWGWAGGKRASALPHAATWSAIDSSGDGDDVVECATPKSGSNKLARPSTADDPDVLCFGDELRLWGVSEYAVAASSAGSSRSRARGSTTASVTSADVGGYVGVYHKGRKRRARTGQQPLACVPPLGDDAPGVFVEAAFRCVDPRGLKKEGAPVRVGDAFVLVDRDSHVWNTNIAGVRGYLAPRLRGERGETRVKFADDVSAFWRNGDGLGAPSPTSGSTTPHVRYGDALWLVTCPASRGDPTDPGGGRGRSKEHVLTNFKMPTSSLIGGYVTIDPRGYPLQFMVERPPPELDVVEVGRERHHRVAWGEAVAFENAATVRLTLSSGAEASCDLSTMTPGSRKWLRLDAGRRRASSSSSIGDATER